MTSLHLVNDPHPHAQVKSYAKMYQSLKIQEIQDALPLNISMEKGQSSSDFNQYAMLQLFTTTLYKSGINKVQLVSNYINKYRL